MASISEQVRDTVTEMRPQALLPTRLDKPIRPDHDLVFTKPQDFWPTFRVEFGFQNGPADAVVLLNVSGIAGGGPATQTLQVAETIRYLQTQTDQPPSLSYVDKIVGMADFVDADLTGHPPQMLAEVKSETNVPLKYQAAEEAMIEALTKLVDQGKRDFVFISNGYEGYAPYAVKEAMKKLDAPRKKLRAKVVIFDSSLPDSSNPTITRDLSVGYPTDRFSPEAFKSDENTDVYFLLCNWVPANPELYPKRAPEGVMVAATSLPFSNEYVRKWLEISKRPKDEVRQEILGMPDFPHNFGKLLQNPNIIYMPFFASGGYYDENNVNRWMTKYQYEDMQIGTRSIISTIDLVSRSSDRPVLLTGVKPFIDMARFYAREDAIANVFHITDNDQLQENLPRGVYLMDVPSIKQKAYQSYIRAADVALTRSTQTNTMGEAVLAGIPMMVISMPENGYMDSEHMDKHYASIGGLAVSGRSNFLPWADVLERLATDPKANARLTNIQRDFYKQVYRNLGSNFVTVVSHLSGIPYWE